MTAISADLHLELASFLYIITRLLGVHFLTGQGGMSIPAI